MMLFEHKRLIMHSYVRDFLSPLEIWLFSALNDFLGYGRFVPTTVGDLSEPIWVSLNGREGHENITGQLLVKTVFGEAPPTPSFEQFTTQAPDRGKSVLNLLRCLC